MIEVTKYGASDFIQKPDFKNLEKVVIQAIENSMSVGSDDKCICDFNKLMTNRSSADE